MQSPAFNRLRLLTAIWIGIGAIFAAQLGAQPGFPLIDPFSAVDVGSEVAGFTGLQDANGVLHFGSHSLLSFDGERWRSSPISATYGLRGLDIGKDGRLWAGAIGEIGWFEPEQGVWKYHSLLPSFSGPRSVLSNVWHAFAFGGGAVFATGDSLLYWNGKSMRSWSMPGSHHVWALKTEEGVFIQHQGTGLHVMKESGPELVAGGEALQGQVLFWMERLGSGWLMVTGQGLHHFADGNLTPVSSSDSDKLRTARKTGVVALPDGRLAIGTVNDGVFLVTRSGVIDAHLNKDSGLRSSYAVPLLVDRDRQLWVGSMGTIFRVPLESRSTIYDTRFEDPARHVTKIERYDGKITVAASPGLFSLDEAKKQLLPLETGVASPRSFLTQDRSLFVSGYRTLARLDGQKLHPLRDSDTDVLAMGASVRKPGAIYAADAGGIYEITAEGTTRPIVRNLPDTASGLVEDRFGTLWIATRGFGLFSANTAQTDGAAISVSEQQSGLVNSSGAVGVTATHDGRVLVLNKDGAWLLKDDGATFAQVHSAPSRPANSAAQDPDHASTWILYSGNATKSPLVARLTIKSNGALWEPYEVEGLAAIGIPRAIYVEPSTFGTTLWVGGTLGLLRHVVDDSLSSPTPRAPNLRAVAHSAQEESSREINDESLAYSTGAVELEFAAPEKSRRRSLRIETRIDGLDANWTPLGASSRRELSALREGSYTVRARVVAETGATSPETSRTFVVLPPWWRTKLAMAGFSIAALGVISGGVWLRLRSLRRRTVLLEKKVRERTDDLERASAAKTEFVAAMSHDIRNPLNGIVGLALALEDTRLDHRQREIVATLRECTTYLSTLVDDVLDFASIEAGKVELRPAPFAPGQLLYSVVMALKGETAERGAKLLVEIDPHLPATLVGDAGRIQQILVNYVSNALKYAGGTIIISAKQPPQNPSEVEFSVSDSGRGINAEEQATLFTKFSRLDSARRTDVPGTGLGLASCRALADLMSGSVGVVSQQGKGSRFFLRLPLAVAAEVAPVEERELLPDTHVLLVEDTDYNAWAASAVLAKLGLACERARNGEEALRMFGEKHFNVVLLDRNLPDMDGTEVAQRMRKMETEAGAIPAVLLAVTAYCTADDRKLCLDSGMDAFVGKPITPEKLRRVLAGAARRILSSATLDVAPDVKAGPVDTSMLAYLADEDTPDALERQIERFVDSLSETGAQLTNAAASGDSANLGKTAHLLVSQARMVGGGSLAEAAASLERHAREGDLSACSQLLARVEEEMRAVTAALRHRRTSAQSV